MIQNIKERQIWTRNLPDNASVWRVEVLAVTHKTVTFRVIEYNGREISNLNEFGTEEVDKGEFLWMYKL